MISNVYFVDKQHGWAVGSDGLILVTENGGRSWNQQNSGITTNLLSVQFTDIKHGWAAGNDSVVLFTDNGGQNWQLQNSGIKSLILYSVHFIDEQHGWVVGMGGEIFATINGGNSWQLQASGVKASLNSVQFIDTQLGWAVGGEVILATNDGGNNWYPQNSGVKTPIFNSVHFIDKQHGWVVDASGRILATENGGQSWQSQTSGVSTWLQSVQFIDAQHGWIVGFDGIILATDDGGHNWQQQTSGVKNRLDSVHFIDEQHGWVVGTEGMILATENGGRSWKQQTSRIESSLFSSIQFIDIQHGWVIGSNGVIFATENGGQSWQWQTGGEQAFLYSMQFVDSQRGWVVGISGRILATNNGGNSWWLQASGVETMLNAVQFIDTQHGWAVGEDGVILVTNNGGSSWQPQSSGVKTSLDSVQFINMQRGWVVGEEGVILTTNNGGNSWQPQSSVTKTWLKSIQFIDVQHGLIIDSSGGVFATDNGGLSWLPRTSGIGIAAINVNSVKFTDIQHGWAVGEKELIFFTNNGGRSWQSKTSETSSWLQSIQFIDAQHGWIVGDNGVILATDNGGDTWKITSSQLKTFADGQTKLAVFPSPLALLLLVLSGCLVFVRVYSHWAEPHSLQGGISDAPIDSAEDDRLGRLELVKTLADLIRNRDTVPPLAIAITAPWGSGKSSMLGLLREELKGEVFTVLLNAWHYRDDGQLLAALMEHIREQALPPLLSLDNLLFRARLLQQRWFSGVGLRTLMVLLVAVIAAVFFARQQDWQVFSDWLSQGQKSLELPTWLAASVDLPWFNTVSVLLAGLVGYRALKAGYASLNAFSPELVAFATQLGKSSREAVQVADWAKDAGLRFRFAKDFEEVANALGKGRLLLLIDDLDRCEPKQIETVMSTLNFLFSSSAPCYAVLAMDWGYVTDALGLAFKEIAAARKDTDTKGKAFAEHYVEKIVQISIDLPAVDGSRVALVDNSQPRSTAVVVWWEKLAGQWIRVNYHHTVRRWTWLNHRFACYLVRFLLAVLLGIPRLLVAVVWRGLEAFAWFCWQLLKGLNAKMLSAVYDVTLLVCLALVLGSAGVKLGLVAQQFVTVVDKPQVTTAPANSKPEPIKPVDEITKPIEPTKTTTPVKVEMVDEELYPTRQWLGFFTAGLAVMLLLMVWRLSLRMQDTQVFITVMKDWRDFLSKHHDTPRDWKRLMNRARLFAMRVRVNQRKAWFESFDKKWQAFRFESSPLSVIETPVIDERLAMHLMMFDIYSKGELVRQLPALLHNSDDEWNLGLVRLDNSNGSWVYFDILENFIDQLAPAKKETSEGKQAREQFGLWLSLYAGLNSTRQNMQLSANNTNVQT